MFKVDFANLTIIKTDDKTKCPENFESLEEAKEFLRFEIQQKIDALETHSMKIKQLTIDDVSQLGFF